MPKELESGELSIQNENYSSNVIVKKLKPQELILKSQGK